MSLSSTSAVTIQRAATKIRAEIKIQAMFRGQQSRNQQLLEAAESRGISEVENLLAKGAKINATDKNGETALYLATKYNHVKAVQLLLAKGADVNVTNKYGKTPLHCAAFYGSEDIVQALVIAGADVNATNNDGKTVLHDFDSQNPWAHEWGNYNVKNAIEAGKKKLISLYENQQCQLKTLVNSPIHECESLREPLLQNKPEKLNETQIQQAIKYRKEKKLGTINSLIKIFFQV